jgi:peroxiredoxin
MRLKPVLFFLVVGSLAGYLIYKEATREGRPGVINIGQQAPDFSIKDENGQPVKLSDFRGKLVFLNFWATWCEPCIEEMPAMETITNAFKDKKFQMLTISVDLDWSDVKKFYKEYNLTMPVLLDPGQQVAKGLYKVTGYPETFLIDANGSVVKRVIGAARWADPQVMANLESLMPQEGQASLQ